MNAMIVCILISVWLCCASSGRFEPTQIEILKALAFQLPEESWGYQARQKKELRVFAFGGSNTRNDYYPAPIIKDFSNTSSHPNWSGSLHRLGLGGVNDNDVVGLRFEFENWEHSRWPNVIMLEFSANIFKWNASNAVETVDAIVNVLRRKYNVIHLPEPDFMFLELFNVRQLVDDMVYNSKSTLDHRLNMLETISDSNLCNVVSFRHCSNVFALRRVAAFYDYPTVSWRELGLNAFIRYYLATNGSFWSNPWNYTMEGLHINQQGGILLYDTLLGPFFHQIMTPRDEPKWEGRHSTVPQKRMFPPSNRSLDLMSQSWQGFVRNMTQLIRQPCLWHWMSFHNNEVLTCSTDKLAKLTLDFAIPLECDHIDTCTVSIGFLHSWNASHIGHLECGLYNTNHTLISRVIVNSTLDENGNVLGSTGEVRTNIKVPLQAGMQAGNYSFDCGKLDDRLTCLTSFAARSIMEV